jgi:hypothetical protein
MIPFELLSTISEKLSAYRGDGKDLVLFDTRDVGNYSNFHWDETCEMLSRIDPTGFSLAMLINEMIEATIDGSKVKLNRILREAGFIEKLAVILDYKDELMDVLEDPMRVFMERIERIINEVSPDFGVPTSREVALCMRDAVYCMEKGMTIQWIMCEPGFENHSVGLQEDIVMLPSIAEFAEALKYSLPYGVHLARIGYGATAIGIKKPGRILYMSSLKLNAHSGGMKQEAHSSENLGEKLDLDGFAHRYPLWVEKSWRSSTTKHTDANMKKVGDIARDSIIWLVMMMELANQAMDRVDPGAIRLSESGRLALPHDSVELSNLPVPFKPSWTLECPSLPEMMDSLGLSDWELRFVSEALEGVDAQDFMPIGTSRVGMCLSTRKLAPVPSSTFTNLTPHENEDLVVPFTSINDGIAGTEKEIRAFVSKIFQVNLADYLISFGNFKYMKTWKKDAEWFKEKLAANALAALDAPCSEVKRLEFSRWSIPKIHNQSTKHKGFKPLCFIKGKGECDVMTHVYPQNDHELASVLGLSGVNELPEHLQGWSRSMSWATGTGLTPYERGVSDIRWFFGVDDHGCEDEPHASYEAFIYFNSANHPTGANKPRW